MTPPNKKNPAEAKKDEPTEPAPKPPGQPEARAEEPPAADPKKGATANPGAQAEKSESQESPAPAAEGNPAESPAPPPGADASAFFGYYKPPGGSAENSGPGGDGPSSQAERNQELIEKGLKYEAIQKEAAKRKGKADDLECIFSLTLRAPALAEEVHVADSIRLHFACQPEQSELAVSKVRMALESFMIEPAASRLETLLKPLRPPPAPPGSPWEQANL